MPGWNRAGKRTGALPCELFNPARNQTQPSIRGLFAFKPIGQPASEGPLSYLDVSIYPCGPEIR